MRALSRAKPRGAYHTKDTIMFMTPHIYKKGALYAADCPKCGATNHAHEWAPTAIDVNDVDKPQRCNECGHAIPPDAWMHCGKQYAGRYSADGYLDCTDMHFSTNLRTLKRELREFYGE